nr:MAG TPA: hypothetical protein [Caudoviricetes sp.]
MDCKYTYTKLHRQDAFNYTMKNEKNHLDVLS